MRPACCDGVRGCVSSCRLDMRAHRPAFRRRSHAAPHARRTADLARRSDGLRSSVGKVALGAESKTAVPVFWWEGGAQRKTETVVPAAAGAHRPMERRLAAAGWGERGGRARADRLGLSRGGAGGVRGGSGAGGSWVGERGGPVKSRPVRRPDNSCRTALMQHGQITRLAACSWLSRTCKT